MSEQKTTTKEFLFEKEYVRCVAGLECAGIISLLPKARTLGVIGIDDREYPLPTREQVAEIFARNRELVEAKVAQGFDRLELVPLAMPVSILADLLAAAIIRHGEEGNIFETRRAAADPLVPVRVNAKKQVWIWEVLERSLDTDQMVYFPKDYAQPLGGLTKTEAINSSHLCALPGWSVGLVENLPVMPAIGQGKVVGGRKQLEIGSSPREYLQMLQGDPYRGETGRTLEDFLVEFLSQLETTNEVSRDVRDKNALWCLGQYLKISYAETVPTGRFLRDLGRVRLDLHRTGNKLCAQSFGAATMVRLPGNKLS